MINYKMYIILWLITALGIGALIAVATHDSDAMEQYQRTHSFDTCHHNLYN